MLSRDPKRLSKEPDSSINEEESEGIIYSSVNSLFHLSNSYVTDFNSNCWLKPERNVGRNKRPDAEPKCVGIKNN